MNKYFNKNGFAAFILVISISTLMLTFSFMASIEVGHFYDEVITKENRLISYYAGYACIDQAVLALAHNYFFQTSKEIKIPELNCSIDTIPNGITKRTITTHGEYKNIKVKRSAIVNMFDTGLEIVSVN
jgi:hypothetical protein